MKVVTILYNTSHYIILFRLNLIKALQKEGYKIIAISPLDNYSHLLEKEGVKHIPVIIDNKGYKIIDDLKFLIKIYMIYRKISPYAALHFTIKPNIYGSIAARLVGVPVVNNVTGLGTAFLSGRYLSEAFNILYRFSFKKTYLTFFQNKYDRDHFLKKRIIGEYNSALLPGSGIDLEKFTDSSPAKRNIKFTFLMVARVIKDKGIFEYIDAIRFLWSQGYEFNAQLLGQLDVKNRGSIDKDKLAEWVGEGVIEYLGVADDVREFMLEADCVVLPSYREGTSKVLLEAAALSRPIVTTNVPGCNNVVVDGVNGYLCEPRSYLDLANSMKKIFLATVDERNSLGAAGRRIVVDNFDEKIVINSYIKALNLIPGNLDSGYSKHS